MNNINVSNEQLLEDIRLTELELDAYVKLYQGFQTLSELPENIASSTARLHNMNYQRYLNSANECNDFLLKLRKLKTDRGLD